MKKNFFVLVVLAVVIMTALALKALSPSNKWICDGGRWVKQGKPKTEMPTTDCYDNFSMKKEMDELSALFNDLETDNLKEDSLVNSDQNTNDLVALEPNIKDDMSIAQENTMVEISAPQSGEIIQSPYQIRGFARGNWFFEASFPVILRANDGTIIAETYAQAQSDWMTEEMVPFVAQLEYLVNGPKEASLILKKDNPSGLEEYDAEVSYSVVIN